MSSYPSPPPQSKWFLDDQILEEPNASFFWCGLNEHVGDLSVENNSLRPDVDEQEKRSSSKRLRSENGASMPNKACREKMRRDRLNDRFLELSMLLEPGRTPSSDKVVILTNALHTIDELKAEAHQVTESNEKLREAIKKLKLEKSELRDEKQKLKAERERLEHEMKLTTLISSGYNMPHPASLHAAMAAFQAANVKPGVPAPMPMGMWQWMPPGALDTSQDHKLRPPVA